MICRLLYKLTLNFYSLLLSQFPFSSPFELLGTLSNNDDDGSENVTKKINLCSLKLNRVCLDTLSMSNSGDFSWS